MEMLSACSGECCVCGCEHVCLVGHGEDGYFPASVEQVMSRLDNNEYPFYKEEMLKYVANQTLREQESEEKIMTIKEALETLRELSIVLHGDNKHKLNECISTLEKSIISDDLYCKLACALTHDIDTCNSCKKCGENSGEIRLNMIEKLANLFGEKPFWDNEGE